MIRPAHIRKNPRVRYEPPVAAKRWPEAITPAESPEGVQGRSSWRTPRAELHHGQDARAVGGADDRTGAEWLAELMNIA